MAVGPSLFSYAGLSPDPLSTLALTLCLLVHFPLFPFKDSPWLRNTSPPPRNRRTSPLAKSPFLGSFSLECSSSSFLSHHPMRPIANCPGFGRVVRLDFSYPSFFVVFTCLLSFVNLMCSGKDLMTLRIIRLGAFPRDRTTPFFPPPFHGRLRRRLMCIQ